MCPLPALQLKYLKYLQTAKMHGILPPARLMVKQKAFFYRAFNQSDCINIALPLLILTCLYLKYYMRQFSYMPERT